MQTIREYIIESINWVLENTEIESSNLDDDMITLEDNLNVENLRQLINTYEDRMNTNTSKNSFSIIFWICLRLLQYEDLNLDKEYTPYRYIEYELEEDEWSHFNKEEGRMLYWGNYFGDFDEKQYVLIKFEDASIPLKDYFSIDGINEVVMSEAAYFWLIVSSINDYVPK